MLLNNCAYRKSQTSTAGSVGHDSEPEESNPWLAGPDMQAQVQAWSCLIRCAAPPPASRPDALLPSLFTPGPWRIPRSALGGQPPCPPNPLGLTSLPLCLSPRLSCSSVPFPQRYGAADLPDADLKLRERLGHALPVAFGILWRQRVLIRAYLAPTLPSRRPGR